MPDEKSQTGWDKETAIETFETSMRLVARCVEETERFLNQDVVNQLDEVKETWADLRQLVRDIEFLVKKEPKTVFRQQFDAVRQLLVVMKSLRDFLGGNPAEMVKLANNLADLNVKTLKMQIAIEKEYGSAAKTANESAMSNILEELDADQVSTLYRWIEENREFKKVMGAD